MAETEEGAAPVPPDIGASTGAIVEDADAAAVGSESSAGESEQPGLAPLIPSPAGTRKAKAKKAAKKGRGRPRKYANAAEEREARNQRLKEKRQVEAALAAAEAATRGAQPPATDAEAKPSEGGESVPAAAMMEADPQLSAMIGLTAGLASVYVPPENGGGELSTAERKALGDAWALYIGPKLGGAVSPLTQAIVTTVQVFALRAFTYRHQQANAPQREQKPDAGVTDDGATAAPPVTRKPGAPVQAVRGSNAPPKKKNVRIPLYTGAD